MASSRSSSPCSCSRSTSPTWHRVSRCGGPRGDPAVAHGLPHQLRGGRDRLGGPSRHLLVDPTDRPSSRVAQHHLPATAVHPSVWASLIARFEKEPVALRIYGLLLLATAVSRLGVWWY